MDSSDSEGSSSEESEYLGEGTIHQKLDTLNRIFKDLKSEVSKSLPLEGTFCERFPGAENSQKSSLGNSREAQVWRSMKALITELSGGT